MRQDVIHINNPDKPALQNAYRSLPQTGEISLDTSLGNLNSILVDMESSGFIGIKIESLNPGSETANIKAYKGKSGPCYNTGRFAIYLGTAMAALDDDNHILFVNEETPVCEKTAKIYRLPVYEKHIKCSDGNPDLIAKLDEEPEIFNCSTFEEDQEKLYQLAKERKKAEGGEELFYPGPFRLLIMSDGRIIRRGQNTLVPKSEAGLLKKKDGLFRLKNFKSIKPEFFSELYRTHGARCLLENYLQYDISESKGETDLSALGKISKELEEHLLKLIEHDRKYFILTGSNTDDISGCCPSEAVTEANRLAKSGILASYNQPVSEDACPVTIYAFKNEISVINNGLHFNIDKDFRQIILKKLKDKSNITFKFLTKWILLAFIAVTLAFAITKAFRSSSVSPYLSLYEQLQPRSKDQKMVLLFHYAERCVQCLNMEKFTTEVLNEDFPDLLADSNIQFKLVVMDAPENKNLVERFDLFSTTIVLVQFENMKEKKIVVLKDLWKDAQDEPLFKSKIRRELHQFLNHYE